MHTFSIKYFDLTSLAVKYSPSSPNIHTQSAHPLTTRLRDAQLVFISAPNDRMKTILPIIHNYFLTAKLQIATIRALLLLYQQ